MSIHETPTADTNIRIRVHDATSGALLEEYRTHNTTRTAYHEAIVAGLAGTAADLTVDALVLGDSTADTSTLADSAAVGNELFRTSPTDAFTDGQQFVASVFLDSTEGNGQTFEEAALVAEQSDGSDLPLNRFLIDDPGGLISPKSENETVTIDIKITQKDA
jgi:hypothetical protein